MYTGFIEKPSQFTYLRSILYAYLQNINRLSQQNKGKIPAVVDSYHLLQSIEKNQRFVNFTTGIYMKNNKKVFIKTWQGGIKDVNYFLLVNEYNAMRTLQTTLPKKSGSHICFPKLYGYIMTSKQLSLIYEYIHGTQLAACTTATQCRILENSLHHLESVSHSLTKRQRRLFSVRSAGFYFFSLPIITYFVLLTNRKHTNCILAAFWKALRTYPYLSTRKMSLAHADLNPNNIIIAKKKIYMLDGERLRFTLSGFDNIHMLIAKGNSSIRSQLLANSEKYLTQNEFAPFLLLYICLQYLLSTNHDSETKKYYLKLLPGL